MKKILIYCNCLFALIIAGCGSTKTIATNNPSNVNTKKTYNDYFIANQARLQKDYIAAKDGYLKTIKQDPNNDAAYYYYAKISIAEGNNKEALPYIKKATELQPNNKYYLELYADACALNKDEINAIAIYKKLIALDERNSEKYLIAKAFYESKLNLNTDALKSLNEVEKLYGVSPELSFKKIGILKTLKKYDDIISESDKLIADDPSEIKYYFLKIEALNDAKQKEKAEALNKEVENKFANDARLMPTLAIQALEKKDTIKYLQILQQCINNKEIEPEEKASLLLPIMQMAAKDTLMQDKLEGYAKQILDITPEDANAIQIYANVLSNNKKYDKAIVQYNQLLQKDPNQINIWQQIFYLNLSVEKYDSLIAVTKKAMDLFPNNAMVYYMNGVGHQQKENYPMAIKSFNKALDYGDGKDDLKLQIYSSLGDMYNTQKLFAKSDSSFDMALKIKEDASVLNNYAYYLSVRNTRLVDAEKMSIKSLEIRKDEKTFLDTYAWILYKQAKYTEAEKIMLQALQATGDTDATMYEHYGDILFKLGNKTKALENWKLAKQKGSKGEYLDKKISNGELYE